MAKAISNLSTTWSNTSNIYTGIGLNVNGAAYNANSALIDLKLNSNSLMRLTSNGVLYINGAPVGAGSGGNVGPAFDAANAAFATANAAGGAAAAESFNKANSANIVASSAYDKANSANVLAFNTGAGANAFLLTVIAGANAAVGAGANSYAATVGTSANAFASATIAGANTAVGTGANSYAATVGTSANAFLLSVIAGANTAVGTGANAFTSATIAGANTAVGTGANAYSAVVGTSANAFLLTVIAGANTAVGAGANAFTSATIAGANTAVGTGANAYSATVGTSANAFASATIAGANVITVAAFAVANNANLKANLAWDTANSAFNKANSANIVASAAYGGANLSAKLTGADFTGGIKANSSASYAIQGYSTVNHGTHGQSTHASYGGVIGYAANGLKYGILGYANADALNGNGNIRIVHGDAGLYDSGKVLRIHNSGQYVAYANGTSVNLGSVYTTASYVLVYEANSGSSAAYFVGYNYVIKLANSPPGYTFANTDTATSICLFCSGHTLTLKNTTGAALNMSVAIYSAYGVG